jgi:hypothetical protein
VDLRRAFELLSELTSARVQPAALAVGQAAVHGVAQQLMAEVIQSARPGRLEHVLLDELAQRSVEGIGGYIHDGREHLGDEAPPDHCTGTGDGLSLRGEPRDALENGILKGVRHGSFTDRMAVEPLVLCDRPEQLLDVERNPVGPRVDRVHDIARRRQTGAEDERRHQRGLLARQGCESHFLGDALGQEPRPPFAQQCPGRELVAAIRAEDQQRSIAGRACELSEDFQAQVVRPLEVVEGERRRTVERVDNEVNGREDEHPTLRLGGGHGRIGECKQLPSEVGPRLQACHRACHVEQRRRRHILVLWSEEPGGRPEAGNAGLRADGFHEPGLPDAGFAGQQQESTLTCCDLREAAFGEIEQVVPSDQDRRETGPRACHAAESTPRAGWVIGRMTNVATNSAPILTAISVVTAGPHGSDTR